MSFDEWFEQWESPPSWLFCKDDFEGAARAAWDAALKEKEEENKPSVTQAVADAQRLTDDMVFIHRALQIRTQDQLDAALIRAAMALHLDPP
jgi:hypothetical protein